MLSARARALSRARAVGNSKGTRLTGAGGGGLICARQRALEHASAMLRHSQAWNDDAMTGRAMLCSAPFAANSRRSRPAHTLGYPGAQCAAAGADARGCKSERQS